MPFTFLKLSNIRALYAFSVGAVAGVTVGVVGWGGGQIIIPALTHSHPIANIPQISATGISLSCLCFSSLSSSSKFWREQRVNIPIALSIGIPAVLSSLVGSQIAKRLPGNVLALIFNGFSIVSIPAFFWIQKRRASKQYDDDENVVGARLLTNTQEVGSDVSTNNEKHIIDCTSMLSEILTMPNLPQHVLCGISCGLVGSMIGVGGLPLTMSYLSELTNLSHHFVQGTSLIALTPSIIFSTITKLNIMPIQTTVLVTFGGMVGGYGGAQFALSLTEEQLRFLYMCSLVVFGSRSMHGAIVNVRTLLYRKK